MADECSRSAGKRSVRFGVAMSVGGYLAGPNGEADWIVMDPGIDFGAIFATLNDRFRGFKFRQPAAATFWT